ncbi:MAG: SH3 domain-containing protein, partial [Anaerolineae bacterium]|nr:SH3 domain-containing protein [Anaerolineae bacterium]
GHNAPVTHLAVNPDGRYFVSADINQQIRLWEIEPTGIIRQFNPADHIVEGVQFSRDNQTLLVSYDDHNLGFWNVAAGTPGIRLFGHPAAITSFAYSPDEQFVVSADISGTVSLWNTRTYERVRDLSFSTRRAVVDYNPDGSTIAVGDAAGRMRIWDAQSGEIITRRDTADAGPITGLLYFAEGSRLLTIHPEALVIRDPRTGDILRQIPSPWEITQAVFSPDERYLLTATGSSVIIWDMNADPFSFDALGGDGETHEGDVNGLAFSPDGSAAVSSSEDGTVRLWDVANHRLLYVYQYGERIPRGVAFQADGRAFVASYDNTIAFFKSGARAAVDEWIAQNSYVVQLTCPQRDQYNIKPSCNDAGSVPTLTPTGTLLPTLTPTITLTPSPTLPPTEVPLPVGRIEGDAGRVNVRAENREGADLLTQLNNGDMVFILDDPATTPGWVHIRTQDGIVGWVIRRPVKLLGEGTFLPTVQPGGRTATPTPTMTPPPEVTLRSDNNGNINVRSGPGDTFPIVVRVPSGTTALVISAPPEYIWTQIRLANGTEGWVYRPVVR